MAADERRLMEIGMFGPKKMPKRGAGKKRSPEPVADDGPDADDDYDDEADDDDAEKGPDDADKDDASDQPDDASDDIHCAHELIAAVRDGDAQGIVDAIRAIAGRA